VTDQIAVVTGASAGIGRELARQLGAKGYELWLVARREERLLQLATEIEDSGHGRPKTMCLDLMKRPDRRELVRRMTEHRDRLGLLVNNAGFGAYGPAIQMPVERQLEMIELNVTALTELAHEAARLMAGKRSGSIINVASTASFQPVPLQSVYGATKAYVLSLSCALAEEVRAQGVHVMALCPGLTRTEFQGVAGITREDFRMRHAMTAARCAELGLRDFERGKRVSITGAINKAQIFASWLFPRNLVVWVVGRIMKNLA
jgi:uncharacterized protein